MDLCPWRPAALSAQAVSYHKLNGRMHTPKHQPESPQLLDFVKDKKNDRMFNICCSKQRRGRLSQREINVFCAKVFFSLSKFA